MSRPIEWVERYHQAERLLRLGEYREALEELEALIQDLQVNPAKLIGTRDDVTLLAAWIARATLWQRLGRSVDALDSLATVIEAIESTRPSDRDPGLEKLLATALANRGNVLDSTCREPEALHHYDRALDVTERLARTDHSTHGPRQLAGVLLNRAQTLAVVGRQAASADDFERAFDLVARTPQAEIVPEPFRFAMLVFYGTVLWELGHVSRAEARFDEAIQLGNELGVRGGWESVLPQIAKAHFGRARALAEMGLVDRALASFGFAESCYLRLEGVEMRPSLDHRLAEVAFERGRLLASRGRTEDAIAALGRALLYLGDPNLANDRRLAASIQQCRGRALGTERRFAEAKVAFEQAIRHLRPGNGAEAEMSDESRAMTGEARLALGTTLRALGESEAALDEFRASRALLEPMLRPELVREMVFHCEMAERVLMAQLGGSLMAFKLGLLGEAEECACAACALTGTLVLEQGLRQFLNQHSAAERMLGRIREQREGGQSPAA